MRLLLMPAVVAMLMLHMVTPGSAQEDALRFGFRGGLNIANVNDEVAGIETIDVSEGFSVPFAFEKKMRVVLGAGGFVEYALNPLLSLQLNVLYNQKGVEIDGIVDTTGELEGIPVEVLGKVKQKIKLTYVSVPILAKVFVMTVEGAESRTRIHLLAGPEIGFLLKADSDVKGAVRVNTPDGVGVAELDGTVDIKDLTKSTEVVLNGGGGVVFELERVGVFLEGRYALGLTKFNDDEVDDLKNHVVIVNAGVIF